MPVTLTSLETGGIDPHPHRALGHQGIHYGTAGAVIVDPAPAVELCGGLGCSLGVAISGLADVRVASFERWPAAGAVGKPDERGLGLGALTLRAASSPQFGTAPTAAHRSTRNVEQRKGVGHALLGLKVAGRNGAKMMSKLLYKR